MESDSFCSNLNICESKKSLRQDLWRTNPDARAVKSLMFSGVLSKGVNVHIFALSIHLNKRNDCNDDMRMVHDLF